jgi:hypothetical protein
MSHTDELLREKILDMYPDITKHGISIGIDFSKEKHAYIVKFKKNSHELATHLEKKDADDCMNNIKCVYLGIQIGQFIRNFEDG